MVDVNAEFSSNTNAFAVALYQEILKSQQRKNVLVSPFSIGACLSLAAMGAGGRTADEMFTVLRHGTASEKASVAEHYRRLLDQLQASNGRSVKVANKVYVMQRYSVKRTFNEIASRCFASAAETVDFGQSNAAASAINGWVAKNTNDKIPELISPDALDEDTRMVLVNAIHFKGSWTHRFDKNQTRNMPFWTSTTESMDVPMMSLKKHFVHGVFYEQGFSAIELTYADSDMTMFILLPTERDGLAALEDKLPTLDLSVIRSKMSSQEVQLFLPKFKLEFSVLLNDTLSQLGMRTMFSDGAEFPDLLEPYEPLKVSKIVHKAFIEVNEEGTEAAAATGMIMMRRCMPMLLTFCVDRPFLYFLRLQDQTYFIGRMVTV